MFLLKGLDRILPFLKGLEVIIHDLRSDPRVPHSDSDWAEALKSVPSGKASVVRSWAEMVNPGEGGTRVFGRF